MMAIRIRSSESFARPKRKNLPMFVQPPHMANKPHKNRTEGHWETIVSLTYGLAQSREYTRLYVNRGIRNEVPGAKRNRRPDIIAVRADGTIDIFEVPSNSDSTKKLRIRMDEVQGYFGDRRGISEIVDIKAGEGGSYDPFVFFDGGSRHRL